MINAEKQIEEINNNVCNRQRRRLIFAIGSGIVCAVEFGKYMFNRGIRYTQKFIQTCYPEEYMSITKDLDERILEKYGKEKES